MPTAKPRITITLSEHQHAILDRMSSLGGTSMSSIVVDLLDTALPMLERVVVAMQAASQASQEVKDGLVESFSKAEKEMLPELSRMMGQLDMLLEPVPPVVPAKRVPRVVAGRARKEPPSSNRGVSPPLKSKAKTAAKPRQSKVSAKSVGGRK